MIPEKKILRYKGEVVFEKLSLPYFDRMPKEYFKTEACFIFIDEGSFSVRSANGTLPMQPKSGLLAKCHNYFFETTPLQRIPGEGIACIGVVLYPGMVEELFQFDLSQSTHTVDYNLKRVEIDALLEVYKQSIKMLLDNPELADEALIRNKLKEFVLLMAKTQDAPSELDFLAALFKHNHTDFKQTILNNVYSSLSLEEFAALCNLSLSSFKRRFKEVFRESPKKYLLQVRLTKAANQLTTTQERIAAIAYDCGFESLGTFNRNFKQHFSLSPSAYRQAQV